MSNYQGYLIKVGDFVIPLEFVKEKTYKAKVNTIDEDAYNDNTGYLHRTVIQKIPTVSIETLALNQDEVDMIFNGCRNAYISPKERKAIMSVWVPEFGKYVSQEMYLNDPELTISDIDEGVINYEPFTLTFKGYGEKV